ncbi:tetratricopeptide repeat protein [Lujinxingia vulgaris]|uniref:Tetratricopeptide repeat protein n=1 Tax=Lujinxingia vulgaris TaxID=2600176 RepID=A0A5C6XJ35_9DELT|nr:tetratricopeptide repeat protein [Lujinxingia vulgaris]TXD38920.1 tetratricopeptide repeat protein [Lujinxingia vulgaris]
MKNRHTTRTIFGALMVALLASPTAEVWAQDISAQERERATTDDILDSASRRLDEQAAAESEREVESDLEAETNVTLDQVEDEQRTMSVEEIEALKRRLEAQNRRMITQLDEIIARSPYAAQKPDWMFQKAELLWELRNMEYVRARTEYNACLDAVYEGTLDESECPEPMPDYSEAQAIYEDILREYPDYNRLDEVIFRLGSGLIEANQGAQAVGYLQRLVTNYPNSRYLPDAYLALGEFFFDQQQAGVAKMNYEKVLGYEEYRNYDYALYKLAWSHFNNGEHRESADTFKRVIARADSAAWNFLQTQASNDLMLALAEIDNGWIEARDYFTEIRDIEYTYEQIDRMAGYLELQGKDADALAAYEWFLEERPNDPSVPDWMDAIVRSLRRTNFEAYEERVQRYVAYLNPEGTWFRNNTEEERAISNANLLVEGNLARLANHYHRQAQRGGTREDYVTAADYYQQFIDRFPEHPASFDMTFFLGEIYLYNLEDYERAAQQYQLVVDLYKNDNVPEEAKPEEVEALVRDAAYAVVSSYNELVKQHHPDSILVEMAARAGENPEPTSQRMDSAANAGETPPIPRTDLLKYEEGFVQASDQFSEMYPTEDVTPTVDYVAAEVYKSRGQYDKCVPRYESIIENAPRHTYASYAGNSLLEANYRLQRWDEVEKWARHLLENEIFDVTPRDSLTQAIAYAINEKAIDLKEEDKVDEAATEMLRLAGEFPDSEFAPGAVFNAAAIYEGGNEVNRAVELYQRVIDTYPESEQAPNALYVLGLIFESRADLSQAATYFARLGEENYRSYEKAGDAVYNAAVLRTAMEQWDEAISTYESYLEYFGEEIDDEEENTIELEMAFLEKNRENWEAARTRFEEFLKKDTIKGAERVEVNLELGLLAERMQPRNWEEVADGYFTDAVSTWKELDEEGQNASRQFAAQARFHQGEAIFRKFKAVELSFPVRTLTRTAQEKGQYQLDAEEIFAEVIQMKSPRWVAAAAYRIGQAYKDFAEGLFNLPLPEGLTPDQEFEYQLSVEDLAFPLQERALTAFNRALELALEYEAYNEWSRLSAQEISQLERGAYPITGQEGVTVEHNRTEFFAPDPVTDWSVVAERGAARFERRPKPEPAPALDENGQPMEAAPEGATPAEGEGTPSAESETPAS